MEDYQKYLELIKDADALIKRKAISQDKDFIKWQTNIIQNHRRANRNGDRQ